LKRVTMDLHWLVQEGYVTEFADGRLFTPPPMAEARAKAAESQDLEEHDPENFPEAPAASPIMPAAQPPPPQESVPPSAAPSDATVAPPGATVVETAGAEAPAASAQEPEAPSEGTAPV
jgi:hypothetical protein